MTGAGADPETQNQKEEVMIENRTKAVPEEGEDMSQILDPQEEIQDQRIIPDQDQALILDQDLIAITGVTLEIRRQNLRVNINFHVKFQVSSLKNYSPTHLGLVEFANTCQS